MSVDSRVSFSSHAATVDAVCAIAVDETVRDEVQQFAAFVVSAVCDTVEAEWSTSSTVADIKAALAALLTA